MLVLASCSPLHRPARCTKLTVIRLRECAAVLYALVSQIYLNKLSTNNKASMDVKTMRVIAQIHCRNKQENSFNYLFSIAEFDSALYDRSGGTTLRHLESVTSRDTTAAPLRRHRALAHHSTHISVYTFLFHCNTVFTY